MALTKSIKGSVTGSIQDGKVVTANNKEKEEVSEEKIKKASELLDSFRDQVKEAKGV